MDSRRPIDATATAADGFPVRAWGSQQVAIKAGRP